MSEIITEIRSQLQKYCQDKIEPHIESDEEKGTFRKDVFQGLGELGLGGITISENYGGAGLSYVELCQVLEELSKCSASYAVTISVSTMVQSIIQQYGNETQKKKFLPELTSGKEIGAFGLTESGSGSDAASLKTTAKKTADGYVLNGSKMFITSAGVAKTYIVMARTGEAKSQGITAFIVQDGMKGFSYGKAESKMGWKVSPTRELLFENCLVPEENMLSNLGDGFKIAMSALDRGRITIAAVAVGIAQRAIDESMKYSLERKQFGQPIFEFQGLQFMIADMATELEASRLLTYAAAQSFDAGKNNVKLASMAKMKATDVTMRVTTDAVQVLGGVGYTTEYPVERLMRDAKVLQIVEGTNQIQKVVIARQLKKEYIG